MRETAWIFAKISKSSSLEDSSRQLFKFDMTISLTWPWNHYNFPKILMCIGFIVTIDTWTKQIKTGLHKLVLEHTCSCCIVFTLLPKTISFHSPCTYLRSSLSLSLCFLILPIVTIKPAFLCKLRHLWFSFWLWFKMLRKFRHPWKEKQSRTWKIS